jgi:uncharacterized protein (TIGR03067 family)
MTTLVAVLAVGLIAAETKDADKDKLQGTWILQSVERGGKKTEASDEKAAPQKLVIAGDQVTMSGGGQEFKAKVTLGKAGKQGTIDMAGDDGPFKEKPLHGLYRLDGDDLRICVIEQNMSERPKEFGAKEGSHQGVAFFKREKK